MTIHPFPAPSIDTTAEQVRALTDRIATGDRKQASLDALRIHTERLNRLLASRHAEVSHG